MGDSRRGAAEINPGYDAHPWYDLARSKGGISGIFSYRNIREICLTFL
jgi:hypothetical protein